MHLFKHFRMPSVKMESINTSPTKNLPEIESHREVTIYGEAETQQRSCLPAGTLSDTSYFETQYTNLT